MSSQDTHDQPRRRVTVRARLTDILPADLLRGEPSNEEELASALLRKAEVASALLRQRGDESSSALCNSELASAILCDASSDLSPDSTLRSASAAVCSALSAAAAAGSALSSGSAMSALVAAGSAQRMLASAVDSLEAYAAAFPDSESGLVAGFPKRSKPLMTRQRVLEIAASRKLIFSPDLSTSIMQGTVEQTVDACNLANPPNVEEFVIRTLFDKVRDFETQNELIEELTMDSRANRHSRAGFQLNRGSPRYVGEMVRQHCADYYPGVFSPDVVRDICARVLKAVRASTSPPTDVFVDSVIAKTCILVRTELENIRVSFVDDPENPKSIRINLESGDRKDLERVLPLLAIEFEEPSPAAAKSSVKSLSGAKLTPALMRQIELEQSVSSERTVSLGKVEPFKVVYFAIPKNRSVVDFIRMRRVPTDLLEKCWMSQMNLRHLSSTNWGCETVPEEMRVFIYQQVFVTLLRRMSEAINACWHNMRTKVETGELKVMNCDSHKKKSMIDKWWGDFQADTHSLFFNEFTVPMQACAIDSDMFDIVLRLDTCGLMEGHLVKHIKKLCVIVYCGQGTDADYVHMEHQCANIMMKAVAFRFMEFFQVKELKYESKRMTRAGEAKSKTPLFAALKRTCTAMIASDRHFMMNDLFVAWRLKVFGRARSAVMGENSLFHSLETVQASAGSARSGQASSGSVRPGQASSGSARPGQASAGSARSGQASAGSARSGQASAGSARSGQALRASAMPTHPRPGTGYSGQARAGPAQSIQARAGPIQSSQSSLARPGVAAAARAALGSSQSGSETDGADSGNASPILWKPPAGVAAEASPGLCNAMSRILEVSIQTRNQIAQLKYMRKALLCWYGLYHGRGIPEARYLKTGFKGFQEAAKFRLMNRALAKNQPLIVQHRFLNAWKRLVGLGYVGRLISCKRDKRLSRVALSAWSGLARSRASLKRLGRFCVLRTAFIGWSRLTYCSIVVGMRVKARAEAYAYCSFNRMKSYARARLDMVFSLRSLALCRSLRRLFLAWDEAVVEASLQRYQELVPLRAQLDRAQKRLGDAEVRAATLQRDRDSFKQILGRSEEKNKQLEANEVRLQERLARTQEKLVQTENLRAKAMTRAQQAEARAAKLLAGAGGSAAAPVAAGGSAAAPVAAGFVSTDSLVDCVQCPITMQIPVDPVTAEDNFTYDRAAIEDHFRRRGAVSPMTNEPLGSTRLKTCAFARQVISALFPGHRLAPAGN